MKTFENLKVGDTIIYRYMDYVATPDYSGTQEKKISQILSSIDGSLYFVFDKKDVIELMVPNWDTDKTVIKDGEDVWFADEEALE